MRFLASAQLLSSVEILCREFIFWPLERVPSGVSSQNTTETSKRMFEITHANDQHSGTDHAVAKHFYYIPNALDDNVDYAYV
jgi:hypothetical protein